MNKTAIVILTYNNLKYNQDCIESVRKHTAEGSYELIVVDNGSADGTREWLKTQRDIKLLLNDENAGFPKGCNMGIALAEPGSDILLLNNDTVVTARWLENLQTCLYSAEDIGACGAVCNHNENLQLAELNYGDDFEAMQRLAEENNRSDSGRWEEKLFLIGFCILIKRKVIGEIGLLDEAYSPGYVEDNDYCLRILTAGYRLMLCHDCFIHHYLGSQFRKDLDRFYPVLHKNRALFFQKWGFSAFAFDDIRFASLRLLPDYRPEKPLRVLELGCGIGATLLKIKKAHPNAALFGVEPGIGKARIAKRVGTVVNAPVGVLPLDFPEEYFDCILIGNYAELLVRPEEYLGGLKRYLKKGGILIGEAQNVMHHKAVENLLRGSWRYAKGDRLGREVKSFFARNDIDTLCKLCGYHNPFVFHWYSAPTEEERRLIGGLSALFGEDRAHLYTAYLYTFRFEK
ncbi:MAG TPA: glycosyltransferase [Feifaniaceae bacterium]|nr:glycosyltransferase [Feifaniaceae bacterium]